MAQHVAWIEQLRQDILAAANDWVLSGPPQLTVPGRLWTDMSAIRLNA